MKYLVIFLLFLAKVSVAQTSDTTIAGSAAKSTHATLSIADAVAPAIYIGYGLMAVKNDALQQVDRHIYLDMQEDHPHFSTKIDNYLRHAPAAAAGVLNLVGIKGKHSIADQTVLYVASSAIMSASVTFFKRNTRQLRPDGSSYSAFPSAHTATAFAAAEFMNQEFGDRSVWFGIAAYSAATATGVLRVYNNAHWFSNVVAGAGFGILSAKTAYLLYPRIKKLLKTHENIKARPSFDGRAAGISLSATL